MCIYMARTGGVADLLGSSPAPHERETLGTLAWQQSVLDRSSDCVRRSPWSPIQCCSGEQSVLLSSAAGCSVLALSVHSDHAGWYRSSYDGNNGRRFLRLRVGGPEGVGSGPALSSCIITTNLISPTQSSLAILRPLPTSLPSVTFKPSPRTPANATWVVAHAQNTSSLLIPTIRMLWRRSRGVAVVTGSYPTPGPSLGPTGR